MNAATRARINRANAAHSTGPVTQPGQHRSSLNALRHGLTGQTVVLPTDDLAVYRESCRQFYDALQPQGTLETAALQTIADTQWRLNRMRAMENNLFALGFHEFSGDIHVDHPAIHAALAQAKALQVNIDILARLSLYEQRLNRTLEKAHAELQDLQSQRRWRDHSNAKKTFTVEENGFEFSTPESTE